MPDSGACEGGLLPESERVAPWELGGGEDARERSVREEAQMEAEADAQIFDTATTVRQMSWCITTAELEAEGC